MKTQQHLTLKESIKMSNPIKKQETDNNGFPLFSWDTVPVSAHLGIDDGLTQEQIQFLAEKFPFITFTGGIAQESVEPTIKMTSKAIKKINPNAKILFYWASDLPKSQWKISNTHFPKNGFIDHPEHTRCFDVSQQDVCNWWSDIASKAVKDYACDGIYVDGATVATPGGPWSQIFGEEEAKILEKSMFSMLKQAKKQMGCNKLLIFNPLHGDDGEHGKLGENYLPISDGAMVDDFDRASNINVQSKEYMANTIETIRQASANGKIIIFKGWPGFTWWSDKKLMKKTHEEQAKIARENIIFPLACFLIAAGVNSYFCYSWGWLKEYGTFEWYPEFNKPLGPPKGDAIRKKWIYTRKFTHASASVNLENKTAKIEWL